MYSSKSQLKGNQPCVTAFKWRLGQVGDNFPYQVNIPVTFVRTALQRLWLFDYSLHFHPSFPPLLGAWVITFFYLSPHQFGHDSFWMWRSILCFLVPLLLSTKSGSFRSQHHDLLCFQWREAWTLRAPYLGLATELHQSWVS